MVHMLSSIFGIAVKLFLLTHIGDCHILCDSCYGLCYARITSEFTVSCISCVSALKVL